MTSEISFQVFLGQLTKTVEDFEGQIETFDVDPNSAVPKSEAFVSKLKKIISKGSVFSGETSSKSSETSLSVLCKGNCDKKGEKKSQHGSRRQQEIEKADKHLRPVKTETSDGFYTLYKCILCQKKLCNKVNARRHVLRVHFKMGTPCPTCSNVYFNPDSLRRHMLKCSRKNVAMKKSMKRRNDSKNPDANADANFNDIVKVQNPPDRSVAKKSRSIKIKMDFQSRKRSRNNTTSAASRRSMELETDDKGEVANFEHMEKSKAVENENGTSPRNFQEPKLVIGIERSFFV